MPDPVTSVDDASGDYAKVASKQDVPENYLRVMAQRPVILHAFAPLYEAVMGPGALERKLKVIAYLAASYVNECPYCVSHYHKIARTEGYGDEELRAIQTEQDHVFTGLEHTVLRVARELTRTCTLDDLDESEMTLLSAEQMVELVSVISLANFDNRFNNALDVHSAK